MSPKDQCANPAPQQAARMTQSSSLPPKYLAHHATVMPPSIYAMSPYSTFQQRPMPQARYRMLGHPGQQAKQTPPAQHYTNRVASQSASRFDHASPGYPRWQPRPSSQSQHAKLSCPVQQAIASPQSQAAMPGLRGQQSRPMSQSLSTTLDSAMQQSSPSLQSPTVPTGCAAQQSNPVHRAQLATPSYVAQQPRQMSQRHTNNPGYAAMLQQGIIDQNPYLLRSPPPCFQQFNNLDAAAKGRMVSQQHYPFTYTYPHPGRHEQSQSPRTMQIGSNLQQQVGHRQGQPAMAPRPHEHVTHSPQDGLLASNNYYGLPELPGNAMDPWLLDEDWSKVDNSSGKASTPATVVTTQPEPVASNDLKSDSGKPSDPAPKVISQHELLALNHDGSGGQVSTLMAEAKTPLEPVLKDESVSKPRVSEEAEGLKDLFEELGDVPGLSSEFLEDLSESKNIIIPVATSLAFNDTTAPKSPSRTPTFESNTLANAANNTTNPTTPSRENSAPETLPTAFTSAAAVAASEQLFTVPVEKRRAYQYKNLAEL